MFRIIDSTHQYVKTSLQRLRGGRLTWREKIMLIAALFPISPTLGLIADLLPNFSPVVRR
jgi:hypothetical protein